MKKLLALYYITVLSLQPSSVLAQELVLETASTVEQETSIDPIETGSETTSDLQPDQNEPQPVENLPTELPQTDTSLENITPSPSPSPELKSETVSLPVTPDNQDKPLQELTSTPEPSPAPSSTHSATTVTTTTDNQASMEKEVTASSTTGSNTIKEATTAAVTTGTATTQQTVINEANTTTIGSETSYSVTNVTDQSQPISLPFMEGPCETTPTSSTTTHEISNQAEINNSLDLSANTGENTVAALQSETETGDASVEAQVVNIANTTLIGDCWLYGVVNLFTPYSEDILLPNEELLLLGGTSSPITQTTIGLQTTNNQATVNTSVDSTANTGNNTTVGINEIETGTASTSTEEVTTANTTILGDLWVLVKIVNPHYWQGTFANGIGQSIQIGNELYYLLPWASMTTDSLLNNAEHVVTMVNNLATVTNTLTLAANTGNNTATGVGGSLSTGDATTNTEILNLLNTTIVGSRWYYVALHLFDDFTGDIAFARPDLALQAPQLVTVKPGENVTLSLNIANTGTASGHDVVLNTSVPAGWSASAPTGTIASIMKANESLSVPVSLTVPNSLPNGQYAVQYSVSNSLKEKTTTNNSVSIPVVIVVTTAQNSEQLTTVPTQTTTFTAVAPRSARISFPQLVRGFPAKKFSPITFPTVLGETTQQAAPAEEELRIPLPGAFGGEFCQKYWELCSVGGILVTSAPLRAWERKKFKVIPPKSS